MLLLHQIMYRFIIIYHYFFPEKGMVKHMSLMSLSVKKMVYLSILQLLQHIFCLKYIFDLKALHGFKHSHAGFFFSY